VSGLLLALPRCREDSVLHVRGPRSAPYLQLTLDVMRRCGIQVEAGGALDRFVIPGRQRYAATAMVVEGDWSGAAFLLVAGAIAGSVTVTGLDLGSRQADRAIVAALERCGAGLRPDGDALTVQTGDLRAFDFDATHCPDLVPPLVALATACKGTSTLRGASRLAHKESDRGAVLVSEYSKLGVDAVLEGDLLRVTGGPLAPAAVSSHGDHRVAMSLALAALRASGVLQLDDAACVAKSYPGFFTDLDRIYRSQKNMSPQAPYSRASKSNQR